MYAPLRIETDTHEQLAVNYLICTFCKQVMKTDLHSLLKCKCTEYVEIILLVFKNAFSIDNNFNDFTNIENF